jgi:hypothetical protein
VIAVAHLGAPLMAIRGAPPIALFLLVWRAHMEPKCNFFAMLVTHKKIRTPDVLALRGWQAMSHPPGDGSTSLP